MTDTAELASQVLELTAPRHGASLLPVDLNSTNALIDGIVSLLDETLNTTENVTGIPSQVYKHFSLSLSLSISIGLSISFSAEDQCCDDMFSPEHSLLICLLDEQTCEKLPYHIQFLIA